MNEEIQELQRMAANFSTALHQQQLQIENGLRTMSAALDQAATRISYVMSGGPVPVAAPPAAAATPTLSGIVQVRVVNDRSAAIPVAIVTGRPPEPAPSSGGGGILGAIGSGIGNFFGSLVGGIFGGIAAPIIGLADLVVAVSGMITLAAMVRGILRDVRAFLHELVTSLRGLIRLLFDELTAAGIFPVSRLIASLLFLIDRGITLVLMHVQPIIVWAERVIEHVITWLGAFVSRVSAWIGGVVNALGTFLAAYVTYLIDSIIRPAIDQMVRDAIRSAVAALSGMLFGVILAFGNVVKAAFDWGAAQLYRMLIQAFNVFAGVIPGVSTMAVPPAPAAPDWAAQVHAGTAAGRLLGRAVAEELLGPAPTRPPAGSGRAPGAPGTPPRFHMPGFRAPELELPDMPAPGTRLEELLAHPPTPGPAPTRPETPPPHPVVTGGITVQIRSETVSMDNAEETARVIAAHIAEELGRLTQADHFRRGLPTTAIA